MTDWTEDGNHLTRVYNGRREWLAHCTSCGEGVEVTRVEPSIDYLCDECYERGAEEEGDA